MRERVGQGKKATANPFSISTLRQPTRGFGLESHHIMPKLTSEQQAVKKSPSHDLINRISMRPIAQLTVNKPENVYEQETSRVAHHVTQHNGEQLQRVKTPEERSTKHSRVARARKTISILGTGMTPNLERHIFNAIPTNGGQPNPNAPVGLHAYTQGRLPNGITQVEIQGSPNKVHTLTWKWSNTQTNQIKRSTMFPQWMPNEHVKTLIALQFPTTNNQYNDREVYREATRTYIQRGLQINIQMAGDTVYPVL